jgi:putative addiction module component (TIGR02574 family)
MEAGHRAVNTTSQSGHGCAKRRSGDTCLVPRRPLDEILELPVADRLRAVEEIWDSIVAAPESLPLGESQRRELERRLKLHQEDPEAAQSWESVRSRLLERE